MSPLRLCMISGSFEYDSEASLTAYKAYLAENHPDIETTLIVYASEDDHQSLEPIDETDVLLVFTRRLNTEGIELERFINYCRSGRAVVGVRTASHAFQNWLTFDKEVLGGNYQGHYGSGPIAHVKGEPSAYLRPEFTPTQFGSQGSLYINTPIAEDATLLLTGHTDEHEEPIAWTRIHNGGRVFYTSLGHQGDFKEPDFLTLLTHGIYWAADRERPALKENNPVEVQWVNLMLLQAVHLEADEIHLNPSSETFSITHFMDGNSHEIETVPADLYPAVIARIKTLGQLKIDDTATQNGSVQMKLDKSVYALQIRTEPAAHGEKTVIKLKQMNENDFL